MITLKKVEGLNTTCTIENKKGGRPPVTKKSNRPPSGRGGSGRLAKFKEKVKADRERANKMKEFASKGIKEAMDRINKLDPNNMLDRMEIQRLKNKINQLKSMSNEGDKLLEDAKKMQKEIEKIENMDPRKAKQRAEAEHKRRMEEERKKFEEFMMQTDIKNFLDS